MAGERDELIAALERAASAGLGPDGPVLARTLAALLRGQAQLATRLERLEAARAPAVDRGGQQDEPPTATGSKPTPAPARRPLARGLRIEQTVQLVPRSAEEKETESAELPPPAPRDRAVSGPDRRAALARFPVEDMNRWLASGTVFQIRGEFAYLNLDAMGGQVDPFRAHIRTMGFGEQLGVMRGAPLRGRVLLFRKTS